MKIIVPVKGMEICGYDDETNTLYIKPRKEEQIEMKAKTKKVASKSSKPKTAKKVAKRTVKTKASKK